jgi:hypothetical protein
VFIVGSAVSSTARGISGTLAGKAGTSELSIAASASSASVFCPPRRPTRARRPTAARLGSVGDESLACTGSSKKDDEILVGSGVSNCSSLPSPSLLSSSRLKSGWFDGFVP